MFNDRDKDKDKFTNRIETLIGELCSVTGSLTVSGLIKIDGLIDGNINAQDDVVLGISACCNGNISCKNAYINGKVNGDIFCEGVLTIENCGKVTGNIKVKNIVIKEGGSLDGKCTMGLNKECSETIE